MNNTMIRVTEMNRVLLDPPINWPSHPNPFVGLPASPDEDLQLFLAAGVHPGDPPLPPDTTPAAARQLAETAVVNARQEARVAMASRIVFNQGRLSTAEVRDLCDLPLSELARRFCDSECSLPFTDAGIADWVKDLADQVAKLEAEHERLRRLPRGLAAASLCSIRQLAGGFGSGAQQMLECHFFSSDSFTGFYDQLIGEIPGDYHYTGPCPETASPQDLAAA